MIKEACVENFVTVPKNIAAGASRIELNNNLQVGGTTPSFGVIKKTVEYAHGFQVPVVVMIRPRGGNFIYDTTELDMMKSDIQIASLLGADAVTFGCLTEQYLLNKVQMEELCSLATSLGLDVVMHMAFDHITESDQKNAIQSLIKMRVKRILTHGGNLQQPIEANIDHLKKIIAWANNQIEILPGGGINASNATLVADKLNINQLHGTKIVLS